MDDRFILSQEELAFFVHHNRKGVLLGVPDPFAEMSGPDRAKNMIDVEQGLISRGICKPAFGGKLKLPSAWEEMLNICMGFDYYIGFDWKKEENPPATERYYGTDGKWISMLDQEDGLLLSFETPESVKSALKECPKVIPDGSSQQSIQLQKRVINELTRLIQNGEWNKAAAILSDNRFTDAEQKVFLNAICGKSDLFVLTLCSHSEEGYKLETASVAIEEGVLWEWYQTVDSSDRTVFGLRRGGSSELTGLQEEAEQWLTVSL